MHLNQHTNELEALLGPAAYGNLLTHISRKTGADLKTMTLKDLAEDNRLNDLPSIPGVGKQRYRDVVLTMEERGLVPPGRLELSAELDKVMHQIHEQERRKADAESKLAYFREVEAKLREAISVERLRDIVALTREMEDAA